MEIDSEFMYKGANFIIQCYGEENINKIFLKFIEKAEINSDNQNLLYLYNGKNINIESKLALRDIITKEDYERGKMSIIVFDLLNNKNNENIILSKYVICPKCQNNCLLNINDYKISLYGCENKHKIDNILLNEYKNTQKINQLNIKCSECHRNKSEAFNNTFFKCLTCSSNLCPLCKDSHDSSHYIIDYNEINYICKNHNEKFDKYCKTCNKNLCFYCDENHYNHEIIDLKTIIPKYKIIKSEVEEFLEKIKKLIDKINNIINILNYVKESCKYIYSINNDLLNNYNSKEKHRNYQIFQNINNISNNIKIKDIDDIIMNDNIQNQFTILYNIFNKTIKKNNNSLRDVNNNFNKPIIPLSTPRDENDNFNKLISSKTPSDENDNFNKPIISSNTPSDENYNYNCNKSKIYSDIPRDVNNNYNKSKIFSGTPRDENDNYNKTKIYSETSRDQNENCNKSILSSNTPRVVNVNYNKSKIFSGTPRDENDNYNKSIIFSGTPKDENENCNKSKISSKKKIKYNSPRPIVINKEITIKYQVDRKETKLKIFGEDFVNNNKNNFCIIYNNKQYDLTEYFEIKLMLNSDIFEIKLKQTNEVTNLSDMFDNCKSLIALPDICDFNTSNVIYMNGMFRGCKSLSDLSDISKWDTSNIIEMNGMFNGCKSLKNLPDISKWDTSNVTNIGWMFYNCKSLKYLPDISKWDISKVTNKEMMFVGCKINLNIPSIFKS